MRRRAQRLWSPANNTGSAPPCGARSGATARRISGAGRCSPLPAPRRRCEVTCAGMSLSLWVLLAACWRGDVYIVKGTVVSVDGDEVTLDHEAIEGLMGAMIMPFPVQ